MSTKRFIAIDGDDVGSQLRTYIINDNIQAVASFSTEITQYFFSLSDKLKADGYEIVFCGGDSLLAMSNQKIELPQFKKLVNGPCTVSVGIGTSAEYAYLALQLAKARGKKQVVKIDETLAKTIHNWSS